ncbi:hypothetical protein [Evansella halocellulosilytica]|uniref:hypothetical protein n=1 Tax=Evansella halocellulosilytica TaxID=2011013 RepID=UPI000BB8479C|nr:hypothetical protein [Evansella halocellulosilytica]
MKKVSIVFYVSIAVLILLVIAGVALPDTLEQLTTSIQGFISSCPPPFPMTADFDILGINIDVT